MADRVPEGFRNSIRWNVGHIYVVVERFAFQYLGLPQNLPEGFKEQFEYGTSPLNNHTYRIPTLSELDELLKAQQVRIQESLTDRLD
ncbi:DinB family protein, partial [Pseudomonas sp. FW305-BF6]